MRESDVSGVEELERINREEIDGVRKRLHDVSGVQAAHTSLLETLGETVKQLREENIRDHSEVVAELRGFRAESEEQFHGLRDRLDLKADNARVSNHADRIDSLEQTRDKHRGAFLVAAALQSLIIVASAVVSVLAATGVI